MTLAESCPTLVLNADYRPLSYFPLSLWNWQDAVKAVFKERVNILAEYDAYIHSPSFKMAIPSVISLKEFIPLARRPAFTRFNVFLRDQFTCQYCLKRFPTHELTFDHVLPRSAGGKSSWENVITACSACNLRKANRLPYGPGGMAPHNWPTEPSTYLLRENGRRFPPHFLHESWRDFLYWDTELEGC